MKVPTRVSSKAEPQNSAVMKLVVEAKRASTHYLEEVLINYPPEDKQQLTDLLLHWYLKGVIATSRHRDKERLP